jgi:small-conductance mechanosensitive channel
LNLAIYRAFASHGIGIPLPQREVRIIGAEAATPAA